MRLMHSKYTARCLLDLVTEYNGDGYVSAGGYVIVDLHFDVELDARQDKILEIVSILGMSTDIEHQTLSERRFLLALAANDVLGDAHDHVCLETLHG